MRPDPRPIVPPSSSPDAIARRPVVILGPTAGGKSDLAIDLCLALDGEVISADSMQIYQRLDAGTAKPSPSERSEVPHHLIDVVAPTEAFSVADWLQRAETCLHELAGRSVRPVVVGGTNLYIKALLEGLFDGPPADPELRAALEATPLPELHQALAAVDPEAAQRIHVNDRKRLVRALEVHRHTGQPISERQAQWAEDHPPGYRHHPILIGLHWPAEQINPRINLRVKAMFNPDAARHQDELSWWPSQSLPDEVAELEADGLLGPQAREALGYKQVLHALKSRQPMDEAREQTKIQTRRFAKQQRSWLKRYHGVHWLPAAELTREQRAEQALAAIRAEEAHAPT